MAERRNPLLQLPALRAILALDIDTRLALRTLLLDLRDDARRRAEKSWRTRKPPMEAYWAAVAVYSGHLARCLAEKGKRGGGRRLAGVPHDH